MKHLEDKKNVQLSLNSLKNLCHMKHSNAIYKEFRNILQNKNGSNDTIYLMMRNGSMSWVVVAHAFYSIIQEAEPSGLIV